MTCEVLISALNADPDSLINGMNIDCDAVLVNQCDFNDYTTIEAQSGTVKIWSDTTRGVGVNRNKALSLSSGDIILFADDDIVYNDGLKETVLREFEAHPEADGIFFNLNVDVSRRTFFNDSYGPVSKLNCGRYPTYSLAVKRSRVKDAGVTFSTLFGGGAKYSCGEDSLFIMNLLKADLKLYKTPTVIGSEQLRNGGESTWFKGYNEKFFFDRGVLYAFLYGPLALPLGIRFVLLKRAEMCREISPFKAVKLVAKGIRKGKTEKSLLGL